MPIDLDNLFNDVTPDKPQEKLVVGDTMQLATTPKQALKEMPKSLEDTFDGYVKRIYLFDVSGSMLDPIVSDENVNSFEWEKTDWSGQTAIQRTRERVANAVTQMEQAKLQFDQLQLVQSSGNPFLTVNHGCGSKKSEDIKTWEDLMESEEVALAKTPVEAATDDERLKDYIVESGLWRYLGIDTVPGYTIKRRIDLTATSAKNFIEKRFEKFPDADVVALAFDNQVYVLGAPPENQLLVRKLNKEELMAAIDTLQEKCGGGTNILRAVQTAMQILTKAPSPMNLHHLILVTDAEDGSGQEIYNSILPEMKQKGVTLDFLHLTDVFFNPRKSRYQAWGGGEANSVYLQRTCEATGGEYTQVRTTKDFETKFLEANTRKLLPAGVK